LIADEPTTALDVTIQKQIIDLLESLRQRRQMSMLFITHDLALVGEIADQVIVMRHGEIREQGKVEQVLNNLKMSIPKRCCTAVRNYQTSLSFA
jgi:peptide/nickel transport system ATP-binding protein